MICRHCKLEIAPILDPWGFNNWQGKTYGFFHVKATDNHSEGKYVTGCPLEEHDGEEAEPME